MNTKEVNTKIIAVAGKGGVGKTSLAAVIVKLLVQNYPDKKILAIDADPAVGLSTALEIEVNTTIDDIRKEVVESAEEGNTKEPDIFAGGDVYTGPGFAIDAISAGKEAAISLHRFVQPGQTLIFGRDRRHYEALNKNNLDIPQESYDNTPRQVPGHNVANEKMFKDTRETFTEEQLKKETARCLGCGVTKVDEYLCVGCGQCTVRCEFDAIHLEKVRDLHAGTFETMPIKVAEHAVKRSGAIIAKKIKG